MALDKRNLEQRHLTWWCVRDVPPALRQFLGTRRFAQSLQTHSLAEVRSLRPPCLAHWEDVIAAARRGIVREWRLRNVGKAAGSAVLAEALIPIPVDQSPCAHWRRPRNMMRRGCSVRRFQ